MAGPATRARILALDDARWAAFVAEQPESTPFHHPAWATLLAATYGYRAFAVVAVDGHDRIVAGAPFLEARGLSGRRRWLSLPFTDECRALTSDPGGTSALTTALAFAQEHLGAPEIEVRGPMHGLGWRTSADAVIHDLALEPDLERVRSGFSRSQVIRNIARAEREGVVVRRASGAADLDAFYALHTRTRRRQGVPVQPRRFFDLLKARLIDPGTAFVLLADGGGREAVAGALFLTFGGTTIYKFGASDRESWPLRPNHLLFWTAVRDACARGDRRFDFGRTDIGNQGLRSFKSGWGAAERPLVYSTLPRDAATETDGLVSRMMGVAIRRGPAWVCRGTGEALYRFAASR